MSEEGIYRSRLEPAFPEATRYTSSIKEDSWIFYEDIEATIAHDFMLMKQGYITEDQFKKIVSAIKKLLENKELVQTDTYKYEDVHELIESFVIKEVGIEIGGLVHTARSRNDQVVTAVRLKTRREVFNILREILDLEKTLLKKARETIDVLFPFYTHLQQAQAAPLSHYFLGYFDILMRDFDRIAESLKRINLNPLGSVAIVGTSLKVNRELTTKLLGFHGLLENSFDAVSSRDFILETVSNLNILMLNLSRMMEDLIIWLTSEFGFFTLPDELAFPSSAMPNKKNPCILELARARSGRVFSSLAQLSMVCKGAPSGYVRDLQETKPPLIEAIETVKETLKIVRITVENMRENRERIRSSMEQNIIALDVAERIIEEARVPFRLAHKLVGEMVKRSLKDGRGFKNIKEEELKEVSLQILGRDISPILLNILSKSEETLVSLRTSAGAGCQSNDLKMIREREKMIEDYYSKLNEMIQRDRDAKKFLEGQVARIVEGFSLP
ncbi:MAG: argininosuccinate lyase [Candidatus Brockarchaeota archaeon]|nr:argininosuccinate lyase [Candidatus Brockarchaeota archaeon]